MTREEAIEVTQKLIGRFKPDSRTYKALEMAIQALSQEPTDAISRDELLKAIDTWDKFGYTETGCFVRITKEIDNYVPYVHLEDVITAIQNLSSVTQKSGKWIFVDKAKEHAHCSECDYGNVDLFDGRPHNYCPNCGAKMVEPQESEEQTDETDNRYAR